MAQKTDTQKKITVSEMIESLTGFEEIAIEKSFGKSIGSLLGEDGSINGRALIFVEKKREGLKDTEAFNSAMGLPLKEVQAYFEDDEEEVFEDHPVTESGKGEGDAA